MKTLIWAKKQKGVVGFSQNRKPTIPLLFFIFTILFPGCHPSNVEEAGKVWCDCVESQQGKIEVKKDIFEFCYAQMLLDERFVFFDLYRKERVSTAPLTSNLTAEMKADYDQWCDYRYEHCPLGVQFE